MHVNVQFVQRWRKWTGDGKSIKTNHALHVFIKARVKERQQAGSTQKGK